MSQQERIIIAAVLAGVALVVGLDLVIDARQGDSLWHVAVEGFIGVLALFGILFVLRGAISLKHKLAQEMKEFSAYRAEAESWRAESRKYVEGLSKAIDQQLSKWRLSEAEKEVAFLLLKGLSLKEIAETRQTTEKTARAQSMAVYAKAGLAGRSELSAFFLEDLLVPSSSVTTESVSAKQ